MTAKDPLGGHTTVRLRVGFVLANQFTLTAFAAFIDAIRLASDEFDRSAQIACRWEVLGHAGKLIPSSCGVSVQPSGMLEGPTRFDYIVVVGGLLHGGQTVSPGTYGFLQSAAKFGVPLVGLCTGSFVLARAGLLDGYRICVSWLHRDEFESEFPQLRPQSDAQYIIDRDRMTCAGGTSVLHLAAHIIDRHLGRTHTLKSLRIMIEEEQRSDACQPEQIFTHQTQDAIVRRAMLLMEDDLQAIRSLREIAFEVGISPRQLERRFIADVGLTPKDYKLRLRMARADWMIRQTDHSMTDIALECGFSDSAHLARTFRMHLGITPSRARRMARAEHRL